MLVTEPWRYSFTSIVWKSKSMGTTVIRLPTFLKISLSVQSVAVYCSENFVSQNFFKHVFFIKNNTKCVSSDFIQNVIFEPAPLQAELRKDTSILAKTKLFCMFSVPAKLRLQADHFIYPTI